MVGTELSHRLVGKICVLHGPITTTYQQQLLLSRPELASNIWPSIKVLYQLLLVVFSSFFPHWLCVTGISWLSVSWEQVQNSHTINGTKILAYGGICLSMFLGLCSDFFEIIMSIQETARKTPKKWTRLVLCGLSSMNQDTCYLFLVAHSFNFLYPDSDFQK